MSAESYFTHKLNQPRYADEDYKTYQLRRWNENMVVNIYLKGQLVWNSLNSGTYRKDEQADNFSLKLV